MPTLDRSALLQKLEEKHRGTLIFASLIDEVEKLLISTNEELNEVERLDEIFETVKQLETYQHLCKIEMAFDASQDDKDINNVLKHRILVYLRFYKDLPDTSEKTLDKSITKWLSFINKVNSSEEIKMLKSANDMGDFEITAVVLLANIPPLLHLKFMRDESFDLQSISKVVSAFGCVAGTLKGGLGNSSSNLEAIVTYLMSFNDESNEIASEELNEDSSKVSYQESILNSNENLIDYETLQQAIGVVVFEIAAELRRSNQLHKQEFTDSLNEFKNGLTLLILTNNLTPWTMYFDKYLCYLEEFIQADILVDIANFNKIFNRVYSKLLDGMEPINYSQIALSHATSRTGLRRIFESKPLMLTEVQQDVIRSLDSAFSLYIRDCFKDNKSPVDGATSLLNSTNPNQVQQFFDNSNVPKEEKFSRFLVHQELQIKRVLLQDHVPETVRENLKQCLYKINQHRYFDRSNKLSFIKSVVPLTAMVSKGITQSKSGFSRFFNYAGFDSLIIKLTAKGQKTKDDSQQEPQKSVNWYEAVYRVIQRLSQPATTNHASTSLEQQIAILRILLAEGQKIADARIWPISYLMNRKLKLLNDFIHELEVKHIQSEARLIDLSLSTDTKGNSKDSAEIISSDSKFLISSLMVNQKASANSDSSVRQEESNIPATPLRYGRNDYINRKYYATMWTHAEISRNIQESMKGNKPGLKR